MYRQEWSGRIAGFVLAAAIIATLWAVGEMGKGAACDRLVMVATWSERPDIATWVDRTPYCSRLSLWRRR